MVEEVITAEAASPAVETPSVRRTTGFEVEPTAIPANLLTQAIGAFVDQR